MSTETTESTVIPAVKVNSSETDSHKAVGFEANHEANHSDKPHAAGKQTQAVLTAKAQGLQLLLEELASGDSVRRAKAAAALGGTGDVAAVPVLIAALGDTDADVGREAATSLGTLGNSAATEALLKVLENRDGYFHSVVRVAAIHSLGKLRDPGSVMALLDAIKDPIAEASAEAIRALSLLDDPRTLPALLEVVRNEHNFFLPTTRRAAVLGLAQIGGKQAAFELRFIADNQWEDAAIRATAIEAIRKDSILSANGRSGLEAKPSTVV